MCFATSFRMLEILDLVVVSYTLGLMGWFVGLSVAYLLGDLVMGW